MSLDDPSKNFDQKAVARAPLEKVWEFEAGGDIIHKAVAYDMILFGSKDKRFYALDAVSGQTKWTFEMNTTVQPHPYYFVVANGILYAFGEDRVLYAINAQTGEKYWQFSTGENIWYPPIVANEIAYSARALIQSKTWTSFLFLFFMKKF